MVPYVSQRRFSFPLLLLATSWVYGLALARNVDAAPLRRFLTHEDVAGRMLLDQNGQQIELPTAGHPHAQLPSGSIPTYLAIPLDGGEHLPGRIPTLNTGSQQGDTIVGPLNFDPAVKVSLDSMLSSSRLAVVYTPSRNYLVELLPRRSTTATNPVSELSHLLSTGSAQWANLAKGSLNELEKLLNINTPPAIKVPAANPALNLEAQVLGSPLPAPIPEPSTWMVAASLIVGSVAMGRHMRRSSHGDV
jgi:hypothetical protein